MTDVYADIAEQIRKKAPKQKFVSSLENSESKTKTLDIKIRPFQIAWGIPGDELAFFKFTSNLLAYGNIMPWDANIFTESTYLPDARNDIHEKFVESNIEWLMMVDTDVLLPPYTIDTLLGHYKPLVGGWYKYKKPSEINGELIHQPVVYKYINTYKEIETGKDIYNYEKFTKPGKGLQRIDGIGAGCLLMRRDLAQALGKRPYSMEHGGEDLGLCKKVYDLGFDIHVDWSLECAHAGVSYV
jgi:hypothetical protein